MELNAITIFGGIVAAAVGFALLSFSMLRTERAVWILGAMLFASCLGVAIDVNGRVLQGLFYPLQLYRSELFLVFGIALSLHVVVHFRSIAGRRISLQAFVLAVIGLLAALLRFVHEGGGPGIESVLYWAATLIPLVAVMPILVRDFSDAFRLLRMVMVINSIWVALVLVQIAASPSMVMLGREARFVGLLGNPQHAGSLIAVFVAVTVYLLLNDHSRPVRIFALLLSGVNIILLAWTGSRTGLGMAVLAVTGVLYARFGRAVLWLPAIAILGYAVFAALESMGLTIGYERLASTRNTRAAAWSNLLENGLSAPLIGMGVEGAGDSENGYLYGFAAYGFGMVLLILALIACTAYTSLKLWRRRRYLPIEYRSLSDFLIGYNALYFGGSFFEGYMMARVAANLTFFMIFAGLASQLIQMTDQAIAGGATEEDDWSYGLDEEFLDETDALAAG